MPAPLSTMLELDVMRTLVAISDTGSFTSAAKAILRTPSAVSMQIKKLEEQLGRQLFVREGRSVSLTSDGYALLDYGRQMLTINEQALNRFKGEQLEGAVRFGAPDDSGTRFLPNILQRFASSHPSVEVNVALGLSSTMTQMLKQDQLDLILVASGKLQKQSIGKLVFAEPLVWVGVKNGRAKDKDPLPLALAGPDCTWRALALRALDRIRRPYRIAYTCENSQGQLAALTADLAVAPLPKSLLHPGIERLSRKHGLPDLERYEIRLCENAAIGPAGKAFATHVIDSFADL